MKGDEARRVFNTHRMQQHALNHAEDRGIRTDAERQGEDGDHGEEGGVKKTKQGLPKICQKHADLSVFTHQVLRDGGSRGSGKFTIQRYSLSRIRMASL